MAGTPHVQLSEELLRRLAAAIRSAQLYSAGHPLVARNMDALAATVSALHALEDEIVVGLVGDKIVVDDLPVASADLLGPLVRRLRQAGIERIALQRGADGAEIARLVEAIASAPSSVDETATAITPLAHVRVGRLRIEEHAEADLGDMAAIRRLYNDAVVSAQAVWESALTEGKPDVTQARRVIDGLAQAVAQNRHALLALTSLKSYDNYTFTHMVNVSILVMGQARGLGLDGPLLRELGLAGLMHDIGKVRTPNEILNKPDKLTEAEFAIMKKHTVDGAEILRLTPDIPPLAPVVAFEHHLRIDGSGYPDGVRRDALGLATMLGGIADVYDAMRSKRAYQQAFPTDRILAVLKHNDGSQFDQHLVRRFVQLIGIYPVGSLVKLDTGDIAVVLKVYAPDPHRPQVRVVIDRSGGRLDRPYDLNLWEAGDAGGQPAIVGPLDPVEYHVDPLLLM